MYLIYISYLTSCTMALSEYKILAVFQYVLKCIDLRYAILSIYRFFSVTLENHEKS